MTFINLNSALICLFIWLQLASNSCLYLHSVSFSHLLLAALAAVAAMPQGHLQFSRCSLNVLLFWVFSFIHFSLIIAADFIFKVFISFLWNRVLCTSSSQCFAWQLYSQNEVTLVLVWSTFSIFDRKIDYNFFFSSVNMGIWEFEGLIYAMSSSFCSQIQQLASVQVLACVFVASCLE